MSAAKGMVLKVVEVEQLAPLVKRFRLEDPSGADLPVFSGGAHLTLEIPDADRGVVRRNSYSLISDPCDASGYEIAVQREDRGRGGSILMHERVTPGDAITVTPPANLFALDLRARRHILIGGGIGITPLLSQMAQLDRIRQPYELHYAVHSRAEAAALRLLPEAPHVYLHVSDEGTRMDLAAILSGQPVGSHVYTCGPERLVAAVAEQAARLGWPMSAVHSEAFSAPPPGEPFEAKIASSGQTIHVGADQSLLEALEEAGVAIESSCRGGACGRCETRVTSCDGQILHHDHWLGEEERAAQQKIMPCMSRFRGSLLELDL